MKAMRIDFAGGTVIVTGGTGALGGAVVQGFLEAGARVLATYVVEAEVAPFRERFAGQEARVELRRCDLRRADEVAALLGRGCTGLPARRGQPGRRLHLDAGRGRGSTPPWSTCWT